MQVMRTGISSQGLALGHGEVQYCSGRIEMRRLYFGLVYTKRQLTVYGVSSSNSAGNHPWNSEFGKFIPYVVNSRLIYTSPK